MKARGTTDRGRPRRRGSVSGRLVALAASWAVLAAPAASTAQAFRTAAGHVEFTSRVPLHTFTGSSERLTGRIDLADGTVDFYVDLETLETGIGKRDKDMRSTLETDRFPFAEFYGRLESPVDLARGEPQPARVAGTFTVHGVPREITVQGRVTPAAGGLLLEAEWELRLEDHAIEPPRLLIMKVDQVQKLAIRALLAAENP